MAKKIKIKNPAPDSIELWLAEIAMAFKASEKFIQSATRVPIKELPNLLPWQMAPLFALGARGLGQNEDLLDEAAGYAFSSLEQYFPPDQAVPPPPPAVAFAFCYVGAHLGLDLVTEAEADQVLDTVEANEDSLESMIAKAEAILKENNPFEMFMLGTPPADAPKKATPKGKSGKKAAGKRTATDEIYVLEVSIEDIKPRIWRRLAVPGDFTLAQLHVAIQVAMGWSDTHMHEFEIGEQTYVPSDPDGEMDWDEEDLDESEARLSEVAGREGFKFRYTYDFGDDWLHKVEVKKIEPPQPGQQYPRCLAGRRAAPPEDCGGPSGYWELVNALQDPKNPKNEEVLDGVGDDFDLEECNLDLINARLGGMGEI